MRARPFHLILMLCLPLLAGCQLALPGRAEKAAPVANPITVGAVQVTSLDALPPVAVTPGAVTPGAATPGAATAPRPVVNPAVPAGSPAAAQQSAAASPAPPPAPPPAAPQPASAPPEVSSIPVSPQALECKATGGVWGRVAGTAAFSCFRQTRDAGKSCRRQTDCETECLARSRTCAPITPLMGCNPVLQADGREVTLCID